MVIPLMFNAACLKNLLMQRVNFFKHGASFTPQEFSSRLAFSS